MSPAAELPPVFAGRAFGVLRWILGIFLLATAGLKAHGLVLDPLSQDSILADPRLQIGLIQAELLLGVWLMSGVAERSVRWTSVGFFAVFAAVSGYLGLAGQSSCGCFGRIPVNPWITFGLDLLIVGALLVCRPGRPVEVRATGPLAFVIRALAGAATVLALAGGGFLLAADQPESWLARLRGERVVLVPTTAHVGDGMPGETRTFSVTLTNRHDRPVRIIGGTASCQCMAAADLPVTLEPGASETISIRMAFRGTPGRFLHQYELWTDDKERPKLIGRFGGRVLPPEE